MPVPRLEVPTEPQADLIHETPRIELSRTSFPAVRLKVPTEPQPDIIHEAPQVEFGIQQVLGSLPVETMIEIFLDIADMEPEQFTFKMSSSSKVHPIVLVCRFWFHLARQIPSLWGRIYLVYTKDSHRVFRHRSISRVKERLILAKGPVLDIHIRIDFSGGPQSLRLWEILVGRIQDWTKAVFIPASSHDLKVLLYQMLKDPTRAQSLKKLTLEPIHHPTRRSLSVPIEENNRPVAVPWDGMPQNFEDFNPSSGQFPRLQHLRVDSACESLLSAVGPNLETLQLRCYHMRSLARVLHRNICQLSRLKLLYFEERWSGLPSVHFGDEQNDDSSDAKSVSGSGGQAVKFNFPQLEQCYWICRNDGSLDLRFLSNSPLLSRLMIKLHDTQEAGSDLLFKSCLLPTVTELHLQFPTGMSNIDRILEIVPNLVTLSLEPLDDHQSWYYGAEDTVGNQVRREKAVITILDNLWISHRRGNTPTPLLKTIVIIDNDYSLIEKTKYWTWEHERLLKEAPGLFDITIKENNAPFDLVTRMDAHLPLLSSVRIKLYD